MASKTDIPYSDGLSNRYDVVYHTDSYASASGISGGHFGNSGHSGYGGAQCCPLVVDLLCLAAIIASIGGATVLIGEIFCGHKRTTSCPLVVELLCLAAIIASIARTIQLEITMTTGGPLGRQKRSLPFMTFVLEGKHVLAETL